MTVTVGAMLEDSFPRGNNKRGLYGDARATMTTTFCHYSFPEELPTNTRKRKRITDQILLLKDNSPQFGECDNMGLGDLTSDLLIQIFDYVSLDERDNLAILCKTLHQTRNHRCMDPTRTGTIVIRPWMRNGGKYHAWNTESLLLDLQSRSLRNMFQGDRTRLKLQGLELVDASKMSKVVALARRIKWDHVTSLDISFNTMFLPPQQRKVKNSVVKSFAMILPNLRVLDMSYMKVTATAVNTFSKYCPNLEIFRWKGSDEGLKITGLNLAHCFNLKEIDVEGSIFYCSIYRRDSTPRFYDPKMAVFLEALKLFSDCPSTQIERVNIKGCKWYSWDVSIGSTSEGEPLADIPNEAIIRFVSNTPSLQRLESNLPGDVIENLKIQHPQITFC